MLKLSNIYKTFNIGTVDEKRLFNDFSFEIDKGEFVSIIGSNGSGKTTMLNIISGDVMPDSGNVYLSGKDITKTANYKRAQNMARVFQNPANGTCPTMTIFQNLSIADNKGKMYNLTKGLNTARKDFYRSLLETLGMGLEDRLETLAGALSGGQRQALALLMATISGPDVLLLDEHTAALDPKTASVVMSITERIVLEERLTTLMITHNMRDAIRYGDRLIMLHAGNIILDISGEEKKNLTVTDLLEKFSVSSGSEFSSDRGLLG